MKKYIFAFAIFALLLMPIIYSSVNAQTNVTNVQMHVNGPSVLGTLRSGTYSATFVDPENRDWDYKVYITASNTTGASPLIDTPINGTLNSENNTFSFDITSQQAVGELNIHINCTRGSSYYEKVQKIYVVSPVSLSFEVNNPSNVDVKNATVQFFVDGQEIDSQIISLIGARQTTQVSSEWISKDKEPGWHDSRIVVDLNGDGTVDTSAGDQIIDGRFYVEGGSNWMISILILLIGGFVLIFGFAYISKHKIK
ncbi:MAG: hypothetical protein KKH41_06765 [Candidatus Thermoplasmatota archaeon]|nr:hypothetical protein [Euryarchaeota archaeon]MBU4031981.1 hypothetical protein [Candidatus Thermoplasmatota archaeon]MBU4144518.1 hypothetical protein [Candidatus Thermoplasmatota archaeon]MBU4592269.1 hypothetical protein [Candidatus Thermoplasmatota archaeon]